MIYLSYLSLHIEEKIGKKRTRSSTRENRFIIFFNLYIYMFCNIIFKYVIHIKNYLYTDYL